MSGGITAWGTYLPYWRLRRSAIAGTLGTGRGRGTRPSPRTTRTRPRWGWRLGDAPWPPAPDRAWSRTCSCRPPTRATSTRPTRPRCMPRSGSGRASGAYDFAGSPRSAVATLLQALTGAGGRTTLAVLSDLRTGLAGSAEERDSGDGATAFVCRARGCGRRAGGSRGRQRRVPGPLAACRVSRTRTCGRSVSARSSTCRWPGRPLRRR